MVSIMSIRWCGTLLWSLLGCNSGGRSQGLDEQVFEDGLELGAPPFQVFTHHIAPGQGYQGTCFHTSPPEPEHEPAALERPGPKEPLVVREHEDIILTATLATPSVAAVTWLKDGVEIRRSKRHETASLGDTHTLTIRGAQTLDSAVYSCRVGAEGQDFLVQVEGQSSTRSPL